MQIGEFCVRFRLAGGMDGARDVGAAPPWPFVQPWA